MENLIGRATCEGRTTTTFLRYMPEHLNLIKTQRSPGVNRVRLEVLHQSRHKTSFWSANPFQSDGWTPLNSHAGSQNDVLQIDRQGWSATERLEGVRKLLNKRQGARQRRIGVRSGSDGCALLTNTVAVPVDPHATERTFIRPPTARDPVICG